MTSEGPAPPLDDAEPGEQSEREYGTHADYMRRVNEIATAQARAIAHELRQAFGAVLRREELEVVDFTGVTARELAVALESHPAIMKPLFVACNVAGRAIERDLGIRNLDTYTASVSSRDAATIAGYLKSFLPDALPIDALIHLDRVSFIDKEIRANKGRWEKRINESINRFSSLAFKKLKFSDHGERFELDAGHADSSGVRYGIDVKRIEARRDIHKRCDEIVNKASHLRRSYPYASFGAVIYYPFVLEQINIRDRLSSPDVASVVFATDSDASINQAVRLLLAKLKVPMRGADE